MRAKRAHFSGFDRDRERRAKASSQDLQSSVDRFSSGQEQKFIASTKGMVPEKRDFAKDPR